MAAKFKKQQKIHFWNHSSINIDSEQKHQIEQLLVHRESHGIGEALSSYIDSKSVYIRTNELKNIQNHLHKLKNNIQLFDTSVKCCIEIMCSEHSRQLIKQMLSILSNLKIKDIENKIENVIIKNMQKEVDSMMMLMLLNELYEFKPVYTILERNAIEICDYVYKVINVILNHIKNEKEFVSQKEMNIVQEGFSVLYTFLQSFSNKILSKENGKLVIKKIFDIALLVLKEDLILRETLPTISVIFWLCIFITSPHSTNKHTAAINIIYYGLIFKKDDECKNIITDAADKNSHLLKNDFIIMSIDVIHEMMHFTLFGRICCIRGIYSILDESILCCKIKENSCLLLEALRYLCVENMNASDVNVTFQTMSTISTILEKIQKYQSNLKKQQQQQQQILDILILNKEDCDMIINMLWRHFEDTMAQIERYVYLSFKTFISILNMQQNESFKEDTFKSIINRFNRMSDESKGKYIPLASLIEIYGAKNFLNEMPHFVEEILSALKEKNVCKRASFCLEIFLKQLKIEFQNEPKEKWIETWLPYLTHHLMTSDENSNHQNNIITYLLPLILKLDDESLIYIILNNLKNNLNALIAVLHVGRKNNLIKDLDDDILNKDCKISYETLLSGIRNESFEIHMNTLALICGHPRPKDMPGAIEMELVLIAVKINSRSLLINLQNKWMMLIKKFIERIKVSSSHAVVQCKLTFIIIRYN